MPGHGGAAVPCRVVPPCRHPGPGTALGVHRRAVPCRWARRAVAGEVAMGEVGRAQPWARSRERRRGRSRRSAAAAEVGGAQPQVMSPEAATAGEVAGAPPRPRSLDLGGATEEPLSLRLVLLCIEREIERRPREEADGREEARRRETGSANAMASGGRMGKKIGFGLHIC